MPGDFAAVGSHHLCRCNRARLFTDVEVSGSRYIDTAFRQVDSALGIVRKMLQELIAYTDHLVRVLTCAGDFPDKPHVRTIAEHPSERVTRERSGRSLVPRHDHPGIH